MIESIELELEHLTSANLYHLIPSYLFDYFRDELNDKLLANLINDLDSLIQTIEANNSFKILTLNDDANNINLAANHDTSISSSISETVLNSCKSLLSDISDRLNEIFSRYSNEINQIINLFEHQQMQQKRYNSKITFSSRNDLVIYQRAILVQKLNTKHYDLFNLVFRNVFDYYQNQSGQDETDLFEQASDSEQDKGMHDSFNNSVHMRSYSKSSNQILLENFDRINQILLV